MPIAQNTTAANGEPDGALADVAKAFNAVGINDALGVVAAAIPKIIPHVLINKREGAQKCLQKLRDGMPSQAAHF